jgi:hypothetical protein
VLTGSESKLRNIPVGTNARQTLCLDAIRYCVDVIDETFDDLNKHLLDIGAALHESQSSQVHMSTVVPPSSTTRAALCSWTIVDWLERLRKILLQTPEFSARKHPEVKDFLVSLKSAEQLRHSIQHVDRDINRTLASGTVRPVLGVLTWGSVAADAKSATGYLLQFGSTISADLGVPFHDRRRCRAATNDGRGHLPARVRSKSESH